MQVLGDNKYDLYRMCFLESQTDMMGVTHKKRGNVAHKNSVLAYFALGRLHIYMVRRLVLDNSTL